TVAKANPHATHPATLSLAFKQLQLNKSDKAKSTLEGLISKDNPAETYAYNLASFKGAFDSLSDLLGLILANTAPGFRPAQGTDFRALVESVLSTITDNLTDLASAADVLRTADADKIYINIDSLPLSLDVATLNDLVGTDLPTDLSIDIGGGYDLPELLLFGAASNAVVGGVDFLLAHQLRLSISSIPDVFTSASIAEFIATNSKLLDLDKPDQAKGAKDLFIKALDYLVGDENGTGGRQSLLAAIEAEYSQDQSGDIIVWKDVDGNGQASDGDEIEIAFIKQFIDQGIEGLEAGDETIEVPLGRDTWLKLVELGRALVQNLDGTSTDPISLGKYLSAKLDGQTDKKYLWEELQQFVQDDIDLPASDPDKIGFEKPLPDIKEWLFMDPAAYFDNPIGLRNLLPVVYEMALYDSKLANKTDDKVYEIAIECEIGYTAAQFANATAAGSSTGLPSDSLIRDLCGSEFGSANAEEPDAMAFKRIIFDDAVTAADSTYVAAADDFSHFNYAVFATDTTNTAAGFGVTTEAQLLAPPVTKAVSMVMVDGLDTDDTTVGIDGKAPVTDPASHEDIFLSILMQNPSFGGNLLIDLTGAGDSAAVATNDSLNKAISEIWHLFGHHIETLIDDLTSDS
ncbi:MAG: hypothetical protein D6761_11815, partial [Candidatus Dadabacteria bacterium]